MKNRDVRERLIKLGPERLADALLDLAVNGSEADRAIKRMVANQSENVSSFKSKLAALKKSRRFIDWRGVSDFAIELVNMLEDLGDGCDDPVAGIEQVVAFFEADTDIFEQCDDSSGNIGSVYEYNACDLFVRYASEYPDKSHIIELLIKLNKSNEYGVRDCLVSAAHRFLSGDVLKTLADRLRQKAREEHDSYRWSNLLASVARQLKDAPLYEEALRGARHELHPRLYPDIAKVYLEAGDAETALVWLKRVENESSGLYGSLELLLSVYQKLGNTEKAEETAWMIFQGYRSLENLSKLLAVIGEDRREQVVQGEVERIAGSEYYDSADVQLLIDLGRLNDAEDYLLVHWDKLQGDDYSSLLPIAESMENGERYLAATVAYRALLGSILARSISRYYQHGIKYLKKLDSLERSISDWNQFPNHKAYKQSLRASYARKSSFWSQYNTVV